MLLSVTNNHDGTYTATFDAPITNTDPGNLDNDPNILAYSPAFFGWVPLSTMDASVGNTIIFVEPQGDDACTKVVILDQPANLVADLPFQTATPVSTVS